MKKSVLNRLFRECISRTYRQTALEVSWDFSRRGNVLFIYFEPSNGTRDWINNLTFHAAPYRDMQPPWQCHAGFLKCWESVKPHIAALISDSTLSRVVTVGYSHGAALAVLCHEYVWYRRPDLRETLAGYGFGCPRVLWGYVSKDVAERWTHFTVIRNLPDIVTHVPPRLLGYRHVGKMLEIGEAGKFSAVDAHRASNIRRELRAYEAGNVAFRKMQDER